MSRPNYNPVRHYLSRQDFTKPFGVVIVAYGNLTAEELPARSPPQIFQASHRNTPGSPAGRRRVPGAILWYNAIGHGTHSPKDLRTEEKTGACWCGASA